MAHFKYLIVGGGVTADAAARGIRDVDPDGAIGIVSAETDPPYDRPRLSKGLWTGDPPAEIRSGMETRGVTFHLGRTVTAVAPWNKCVVDDRRTVYSFDKLLLATGGAPRRLPTANDRVIHLRNLNDYRRLAATLGEGRRYAVVGGGFIGSEIAAALAMNGKEVVIVFPGDGICSHIVPRDLSLFLNDYYRQKGVEVLAGETFHEAATRGGRLVLSTRNVKTFASREVPVDGIVAGIGILPNVALAREAKLGVGNGILVDDRLRTNSPDIYAAGDAANFYSPPLGLRIRVEHEDNARAMGCLAGRGMAGCPEMYRYLPSFSSRLFDLGYEAVGEVDTRLRTIADWEEPYRKGVVYYMRGGRVRGVLLWNVRNQVDSARRIIAEPGPFRPLDLAGRLRETS